MVIRTGECRPGFAVPKTLVLIVVLLMGLVLALKIKTEKAAPGLDAPRQAASSAGSEAEIGQPLPEEARTALLAEIAPEEEPAPSFKVVKVPLNASEDECLRELGESPASLLAHFSDNFDGIFGPSFDDVEKRRGDFKKEDMVFRRRGTEADALFGLFSDFAVCSILSRTSFPCSGELNDFCIQAAYFEFLNSSFNNDTKDGMCQQFVALAFSEGNDVPSPDFCAVTAAALSKRVAPDCKKLGKIEDCNFLFLDGRSACQMLQGDKRRDCLLGAALASGGGVSPAEDWLPKVMRSRKQTDCDPLAKKLAAAYCKSGIRQQVLNERRKRAALDTKRIAEMKAAERRTVEGQTGQGQ